eukprot:scaffold958_cov325-Prasinococcus_capsulatus_cf.AAC.8
MGVCTNNEAEYEGLLMGLTEAAARDVDELHVRGDSQLVINQVGCHPPKPARPPLREHRAARAMHDHDGGGCGCWAQVLGVWRCKQPHLQRLLVRWQAPHAPRTRMRCWGARATLDEMGALSPPWGFAHVGPRARAAAALRALEHGARAARLQQPRRRPRRQGHRGRARAPRRPPRARAREALAARARRAPA